jgi:hypothetical protein
MQMAKDMLDKQYNETSNAYWNTINSMAENWGKSAEELIKQTQSVKPVMYSPAEIMDKAQELYGFINKKD